MGELARFQKQQLQEKEEKLVRLYEDQKQRAINRIGKSNSSMNNNTPGGGGGKVRQMFDERRQKAGIDRSYPLEPLKQENSVNVATAPSKIAVRINANTRKITTSSTLSSRPGNGNVYNLSNSRQMVTKNSSYQSSNGVSNTINSNVSSYQSPEDINNIGYVLDRDQQDVLDNVNRLNIENEIDDNAMLAHMEQVQAVYNGVDGKLINVGGKLPSEVTTAQNIEPVINTSKPIGRGTSNILRKDIKAAPLIKKTSSVKPSASPVRKVNSPSSSSASSSASTMSRPQSRTNQPQSARKQPLLRPTSHPGTATAERTPNVLRPSSKQTPRGPSAVQRDDLDECRYCHRRFASDRLQTHEDICARTAKKKRKLYDATRHRLEGTELIQFTSKPAKSKSRSVNEFHTSKNKAKTASKTNNWRQKHEEFIATIRSAKVAQQHVAKGGKLSDLPPPPPSSNPDFVQCPHCGRRFNEAAAERHIPKCANYDFNKPKPGPNKGRAR